jgi:hypothetical protein
MGRLRLTTPPFPSGKEKSLVLPELKVWPNRIDGSSPAWSSLATFGEINFEAAH